MINGHGDDAFRYGRPIVANFSSNVYGHVDLEPLKAYLRERLDAIGHYPEPTPSSAPSPPATASPPKKSASPPAPPKPST